MSMNPILAKLLAKAEERKRIELLAKQEQEPIPAEIKNQYNQ